MPLHLAGDTSLHDSAGRCINIGLINNMPDGALEATERQFATLLDSAADGVEVRLSLYALPDVPRTEQGRLRIERFYSGIENLWNGKLDGLIVTGAEPQTSRLTDEPYWGSLTKVLDWAEHNTHSTIWSCLAAHAAVQYLDGIGRRRLRDKRFGVFECVRAEDHEVMSGVPSSLRMPHSRWNDVPAKDLADCGYSVLTRAMDGEIDTFVKQRKSLFVFFQGHPEYERKTLLLEYRRDITRFLRRQRGTYPELPEGCLDHDTGVVLTALQKQVLSGSNIDLLEKFPAARAEKGVADTWSPVAKRVYGNWLTYLCLQKERRSKRRRYQKHAPKAETELSLSFAEKRLTSIPELANPPRFRQV